MVVPNSAPWGPITDWGPKFISRILFSLEDKIFVSMSKQFGDFLFPLDKKLKHTGLEWHGGEYLMTEI